MRLLVLLSTVIDSRWPLEHLIFPIVVSICADGCEILYTYFESQLGDFKVSLNKFHLIETSNFVK